MRIAYVCYWNARVRDGVVLKIEAQVAEWRRAGHDVAVHLLRRAPAAAPAESLDARIYPFASARGRVRAGRALARALVASEPELVYVRYDLLPPALLRLERSLPLVLEINTDDRAELRGRRSRLALAYAALSRRLLLRRADAYVCVTNELAASAGIAGSGKPVLVLGNGVDAEAVSPLPPPANERPRLVFIGTADQPWQGVDKVVELARLLPEVDFDLVGVAPDATGPENLRAHGFLPRDEYRPILAAADAALGTLALHRKDMREASPLKVREYLLSGLPTVLAYEDTDFAGEEHWFLLRLPNTEANVRDHAHELRAWVEGVRRRRVPADAVARLDVRAKEAARLAFFADVLGSRRR